MVIPFQGLVITLSMSGYNQFQQIPCLLLRKTTDYKRPARTGATVTIRNCNKRTGLNKPLRPNPIGTYCYRRKTPIFNQFTRISKVQGPR